MVSLEELKLLPKFDKSEFKPALSFRHSNFSSEKEKDFKENEVNLNFDFSFAAVDNINFSCDTKIKNLYYDEKTMIYDYVKNGLNQTQVVHVYINKKELFLFFIS